MAAFSAQGPPVGGLRPGAVGPLPFTVSHISCASDVRHPPAALVDSDARTFWDSGVHLGSGGRSAAGAKPVDMLLAFPEKVLLSHIELHNRSCSAVEIAVATDVDSEHGYKFRTVSRVGAGAAGSGTGTGGTAAKGAPRLAHHRVCRVPAHHLPATGVRLRFTAGAPVSLRGVAAYGFPARDAGARGGALNALLVARPEHAAARDAPYPAPEHTPDFVQRAGAGARARSIVARREAAAWASQKARVVESMRWQDTGRFARSTQTFVLRR